MIRRIILLSSLIIFHSNVALALSGFEFYFFGQNIKSFKNSSWLKVAAGAVASVAIHELGHALYFEAIGKSYDFKFSVPSGFAVHSDEKLPDREWNNVGRAGFALQTLIGTGLTLFKETRYSDFTKGWVAMNAVQVFSYRGRSHGIDDDFAMIERGRGNSDLEFAAFSFLSFNNLMRLEDDLLTIVAQPANAPNFDLLYNFSAFESDRNNKMVSNADSHPSLAINSNIELPDPDPHKAFMEDSLWRENLKLAEWR